ncbi:MAG TPA: PAS domain-containing sensor histidine kinase [Sphingobacteriaceae bacterium]
MTLQKSIDAVHLEEEIRSLKARLAEAETLAAENKRLDQEYRSSKKRFETIFEESSLGKKIINADLRIIKVNRSLTEILQYDEEELLGANIVDLSHPDFKPAWEMLRDQLWDDHRRSFSIDACLIRKDRSSLWCHVTSITFEDNGEILGYTIIEDISERKRLEQLERDLQEQKLLVQQQAEVVKATLNTQEKERERIAEGLHNSLGQLLFAAQIELNQVSFTAQSEADRAALKKAADLLYRSIKECRQISHQLMPVILHDFGLKAAIEGICKDLSGVVAITSQIQLLTPKNDKSFEIVVYRLVQELVLNISKHSQATRGKVLITENAREVVITVEDNGIGLDPEKVKGEGIGLSSVRNNVNLLNGSFQINSAPGEGTKITVSLPNPKE